MSIQNISCGTGSQMAAELCASRGGSGQQTAHAFTSLPTRIHGPLQEQEHCIAHADEDFC